MERQNCKGWQAAKICVIFVNEARLVPAAADAEGIQDHVALCVCPVGRARFASATHAVRELRIRDKARLEAEMLPEAAQSAFAPRNVPSDAFYSQLDRPLELWRLYSSQAATARSQRKLV